MLLVGDSYEEINNYLKWIKTHSLGILMALQEEKRSLTLRLNMNEEIGIEDLSTKDIKERFSLDEENQILVNQKGKKIKNDRNNHLDLTRDINVKSSDIEMYLKVNLNNTKLNENTRIIYYFKIVILIYYRILSYTKSKEENIEELMINILKGNHVLRTQLHNFLISRLQKSIDSNRTETNKFDCVNEELQFNKEELQNYLKY